MLAERRAGSSVRNTPRFLVELRDPNWPSPSGAASRSCATRACGPTTTTASLRAASTRRLDDLTRDPEIRAELEALYDDIDQVEWYVGIFAEDYPDYMMMGGLLTTMVANDAFTQALSNPLLARHNYDDDATFTATGRAIIDSTGSVDDIRQAQRA